MNLLTISEDYYVLLDDDDFTVPPVELGGVSVEWTGTRYVMLDHFRHDMAEMIADTGTVAERRQVSNIAVRGITLYLLVEQTNNMLDMMRSYPDRFDFLDLPDHVHEWGFNALIHNSHTLGLDIIGVDSSTRTMAFAPVR